VDGSAIPADGNLSLAPTASGIETALDQLASVCDTLGLTLIVTVFGPGALTAAGPPSGRARSVSLAAGRDGASLAQRAAGGRLRAHGEGWAAHEILTLLATVRSRDATRLVATVPRSAWRVASSPTRVPASGSACIRPRWDMEDDAWAWLLALAAGSYRPALSTVPTVLLQPMTLGEGTGLSPSRVDGSAARALCLRRAGESPGVGDRVQRRRDPPAQALATGEAASAEAWLLGATRQRLGASARFIFRIGHGTLSGVSPFATTDAASLILGRHDG